MFKGSKKPSTLKAALGVAACLLGMAIASSAEAATLRKTAAEPAATLLLPYFEQDLSRPKGPTTVFSVNNASSQAVLAHVTLWSDLSVPILDFNIYLTGYDVQTINLRDILVNGLLPRTASDGQDPTDTISPQGPFSQDINFASCTGQLPPPPLPAIFIQHLQTSLTGKPSPILGNLCAGRNLRGQHRPRLHHGRHGEQLHPALPQRYGLLRPAAATPPTRTCSGGTTSTSTGPGHGRGQSAGPHRGRRLRSRHLDPGPLHLLWPLRRLVGGGPPPSAGHQLRRPLRRQQLHRHQPGRLAGFQGQPDPLHLPGDRQRPARLVSRWARRTW